MLGAAALPVAKWQSPREAELQVLEHEILAKIVIEAVGERGVGRSEFSSLLFAQQGPPGGPRERLGKDPEARFAQSDRAVSHAHYAGGGACAEADRRAARALRGAAARRWRRLHCAGG